MPSAEIPFEMMDHKTIDEEYPNETDVIELLPCSICNRSFRSTLLPRHSVICEKNAKTRKVKFDSSKQRIQGTEMAAFLPKMKMKQDKFVVAQPKTNWRANHDELIRTLKSARGEKVDNTCIITKPLDSEQCPYCKRNFGPKSYDRHVEFCKEKTQRRPSGPVINLVAKERLEARTKYRVSPINSQLTFIIKDKCLPKTKTPQIVPSDPSKVIKPLQNVKKPISSANGNLSNFSRLSSTVSKNKDQISKSFSVNKNAVNLPQKPVVEKKETVVKKSGYLYLRNSRNQVKPETIQAVNMHDKKNISKS
ncbi:Hypothetical protein CINCED_3A014506 [Cinara cedri]|uniref:C2HC/C3H-type domain-containing protein n=1 Tax=Cinara cedri TaxID=506608 RepID=A0A5E4NLL7_9HEMI|nr:Hypothetical protein CINCED_3A014506 [Cinara cedri]